MNITEQTGLSLQDTEKLNSVFSKHEEIKSALIYGSRAMKTYKPGSDIDLTIILNKGYKPTLSLYSQIADELDKLNLIYLVDLSFFEEIQNQDLIDHIQRVGITIYQA